MERREIRRLAANITRREFLSNPINATSGAIFPDGILNALVSACCAGAYAPVCAHSNARKKVGHRAQGFSRQCSFLVWRGLICPNDFGVSTSQPSAGDVVFRISRANIFLRRFYSLLSGEDELPKCRRTFAKVLLPWKWERPGT